MNTILEWLAIGDLTTDGQADEVVDLVSENIQLLPDLMEALGNPEDAIRGHAADALEKVARQHPEAVATHLPALLQRAKSDPVPMVRWHLAMTLGHLAATSEYEGEVADTLLALLDDRSVFVQSWAISSLCIVARLYPPRAQRITQAIADLSGAPSAAIRSRVRKALTIFSDPKAPFPKGWIKSQHIKL
jgi:HEAT repeat protein